MAYGVEKRRKIQFGQESQAGTPVAATAVWRGGGAQIDAGLVVTRPPENVGLAVDTDRSYVPYKLATLDIPEFVATYEQIGYMLAGGAKLVVSGAADGSGTGKIYDFPVDEEGGNSIQPFTIEAGDNNAAARMEYSFPTEFTLTWAAKEALRVSSKWVGRQRTSNAFTVLALTAVEEILAPKIYVHDSVIGTGQIQGTLLGYQLNFKTGIVAQATGDGQIYFYTHILKNPSCTLRLTYEHDSNATTEYGKFTAQTTRLIRILHEGSALTQGSGAYAKKTFLIDLCGKYTSFPPFEAQDGDDIITAEFACGYNATYDLFCRFLLVNALAALP